MILVISVKQGTQNIDNKVNPEWLIRSGNTI